MTGPITRAYHFYCYLAAPQSGIFSISWSGSTNFQYSVFTLENAAQINPVDAFGVSDLTSSGSSLSTSVTTTQGSDLLLDHLVGTNNAVTHSFGSNQMQTYMGDGSEPFGKDFAKLQTGRLDCGC